MNKAQEDEILEQLHHKEEEDVGKTLSKGDLSSADLDELFAPEM